MGIDYSSLDWRPEAQAAGSQAGAGDQAAQVAVAVMVMRDVRASPPTPNSMQVQCVENSAHA